MNVLGVNVAPTYTRPALPIYCRQVKHVHAAYHLTWFKSSSDNQILTFATFLSKQV